MKEENCPVGNKVGSDVR